MSFKIASNIVEIEPESVSTIVKPSVEPQENISKVKAIPASQWRSQEMSALDVFSDSLKNVTAQDNKSVHNEQNAKYALQLEQILNPKTLSVASTKTPLKLETTEAFKQIMANKPIALGPNMLSELYEVKAYIKHVHDAVTALIRSKRERDSSNSSDLDNFIKIASEMMRQDSKQESTQPVSNNTLSDLELSNLTSAIRASVNDDSPKENREITTKANFKAEFKEESTSQSTDAVTFEQDDVDSLTLSQLQQRLSETNFIENTNTANSLPRSLSLDKSGCEVLFVESEGSEPLKAYFNGGLPSLSMVLSQCLSKTEKSYIRHQNNNPQKFSEDLQKALNDVLSNCQANHIENITRDIKEPLNTNDLNTAQDEISESFENVPVEIYENDIVFNSEDEDENEIVKGSDLINIDFSSDNINNNKLVDGKPTAKTSFEVEQHLEDNLSLDKELQSDDLYDEVLKTDKWLQDICAANFKSLEYGCLIYSRREIDANNPHVWNLYISSDCRFVSQSQNFLNKIKESFSKLKHQDIEINITSIEGVPEQCPEFLARVALKKVVADAREELIENNAIRTFIEHMGEDLRTVQLSLHKQLPMVVKENQ
ncbi:MAG: hypothetical protein Q4E81_05655 [Succinatimonas sp.]|nr:hypothetical protein [Succinatimonas sp.]